MSSWRQSLFLDMFDSCSQWKDDSCGLACSTEIELRYLRSGDNVLGWEAIYNVVYLKMEMSTLIMDSEPLSICSMSSVSHRMTIHISPSFVSPKLARFQTGPSPTWSNDPCPFLIVSCRAKNARGDVSREEVVLEVFLVMKPVFLSTRTVNLVYSNLVEGILWFPPPSKILLPFPGLDLDREVHVVHKKVSSSRGCPIEVDGTILPDRPILGSGGPKTTVPIAP